MATNEDKREEAEEDEEPALTVIEEGSAEHKALQERDEDDKEEAEEEEGGDERLGKSETTEDDRQLYGRRRADETDDQYRDRRRKERKQKKVNKQAAINRNRTEIRFLETRNESLERENVEIKRRLSAVERGNVQNQALTVDGRISQAESQLEEAKTLKAAALDASNGADVVKCDEIIGHLTDQLRGLKGYKEHLAKGGKVVQQEEGETEEEPQRRQGQRVTPPKDPKVAKNSQAFQERIDWFDPTGKDPESATVYAIDVALAKDGRYDPRTTKYWKELERRVRAALPHKFEEEGAEAGDDDDEDLDEEPQQKQQKSRGPRMPGSGGRGGKGGTTFYLSADRKQAMIDLGVYDDPKLRSKYIRKYREWDQQNAGRK